MRMRLLELIRRLGECTIQELSEAAGTNPVNLYYHVRSLESADLIAPIGVREGVARRAPAVYAVNYEEIRIEFDPNDQSHLEKVESLQRNWHREAQESISNATNEAIDTLEFTLRWEFLNRDERTEISEMMERLTSILNRKRDTNSVGTASDEELTYVGMQIARCPRTQLPAPRVSIVPRSPNFSTASELRDNRESVAQTA
ncbi:MAG: helix-turn-helix domain-containing protein [Planctomycetota bacterium]|nr:helix-turn-helix domain-containing protein [Planctomycetota bacterium]